MIRVLAKRRKSKVDWNIDYEFLVWVNHWFKEFRKNAKIDLEFHRYNYNDNVMTQKEIIDRIIQLTDNLTLGMSGNYFIADEDVVSKVDEIFDLFHIVYWDMWW